MPNLRHLQAIGSFNAETIATLQKSLRDAESRAAVLAKRLENANAAVVETSETLARLAIVLCECEEYFDGKADAEMDTTSPHATGNREMTLLNMIRNARGRS